MRRARVGCCEALRRAAVGRLPPHGGIALAIGLKRHAQAVGGPDRKAVVPAESEPPGRARAGQVVDRDDCSFSIVVSNAIRLPSGDTRGNCTCPAEARAARAALAIEEHQVLLPRRRRAGYINERTRVGKREMGQAVGTFPRRTPSTTGTAPPVTSSFGRSNGTANSVPPDSTRCGRSGRTAHRCHPR